MSSFKFLEPEKALKDLQPLGSSLGANLLHLVLSDESRISETDVVQTYKILDLVLQVGSASGDPLIAAGETEVVLPIPPAARHVILLAVSSKTDLDIPILLKELIDLHFLVRAA